MESICTFNILSPTFCWAVHLMQVAQFVNCSSRWRLSSGWKPRETRGCELPILCITKGAKTTVQAGEWTLRDRVGVEDLTRAETCPHVDCEGVPLLGVLEGTSSSCFFYYCAMNKLLCGHLRHCYGKPVVEPVRKPGLTAWLGCVKQGTHRLTSLLWRCFRESVSVKVSGIRNVTVKVSSSGQTRMFP